MTLRIPLPDTTELAPGIAELVALTAPPGREPARTMAMLARQPDLLAPFLGWAAALALNGALPHRDHELLALRTAWRCGSEFEWVEHVEFARGAGVTDEEIVRLGKPVDAAAWAPHEAALLRAADELCTEQDITDATWETLAARYDTPALVEIPLVVGQYAMLSMMANALGIPGARSLTPLPQRNA
jgi:alkylhydroperoxidase family enzyme